MRLSLLIALALTSLAAPACAEPGGSTPADEPLEDIPERPEPIMAGIAASMTRLLPLALADDGFADPANGAAITEALAGLETHADALTRYAWGEDAGFVWLARSLAEDVKVTGEAHAAGRHGAASFYAQRLTAHCVACHSRQPATGSSDLGQTLFAAVEPAAASLDEIAFLQQATRQWEDAARTYEELLVEPPRSLASGPMWWFTDYLVLRIRVLEQPARAKPLLDRHASNPELPALVREDLAAWSAAIDTLGPVPSAAADQLARARALVSEGRASGRSGTGRSALVQWIRASALLLKYIAGREDGGDDLAEAYWLLGLCEAEIGHAAQLSVPEYYLEAAVRAAPGSAFAKEAFAMLEWRVAVQYTGSGGAYIPADVEAVLERLRELIRTAGN